MTRKQMWWVKITQITCSLWFYLTFYSGQTFLRTLILRVLRPEKVGVHIVHVLCIDRQRTNDWSVDTGPQSRTLSWVITAECPTFIFLSMSLGSAADTSESLGGKEIIGQDIEIFPLKLSSTTSLPKYLRLSSIPLHLVCQQTEDVIGGRCAGRTRCKIQNLKSWM